MNLHFKILEKQSWDNQSNCVNTETFARLMYNDIMTVIAAHVLTGDSAVDVYANLQRIYANNKLDI